jgi:hypothetical protein
MVTALLATGCGPFQDRHAQIEIKTDLDCSALTDVDIALVNGSAQNTVTSTAKCSEGRIGSLVFLPSDPTDNSSSSSSTLPRDTAFTVVITAGAEIPASKCDGNGYFGCIVARRRMDFLRTPVEILLRSECLHTPCDASTTCLSGGECGPITVDYDACGEVCDESALVEEDEGS